MSWLAAQEPAALALVTEDGASVSYGELASLVAKFAALFPQPGVIACLCNNDLPSIVCYLAALECRNVPLLLPGSMPRSQLLGLLEAYRPRYLFHKRNDLTDLGGDAVAGSGAYSLWHLPEAADRVSAELALLLTTSGSTGSRKLVRLSRRNLLANSASIADYLQIGTAERAITTLPMHYSYGLSIINSHLHAGASVILSDRSIMERSFWELLRTHEATSIAGVPYTYEMLLKLDISRLKMPSVHLMTQAGGRLAPEKIRAVAEACRLRNIRFCTMYGQTEATARIAYLPWQETEAMAGSIGRAIPGGALWLEDDRMQRIEQPGVPGQLVYSGPNVSLGYAASANDLATGDDNQGILHTGDLAVLDMNGYFTLVGRLSRFVKLYGNRVSLDEVESILASYGFTAAAAGTDDHLRVYVECLTAPPSLRADLATTMGINPAAISVLSISALPRTENGKIDYASLLNEDSDTASNARTAH
jgi:acyl-coenzyme A synthetase/AMP-(fatty) acid ligase